MNDNGKVTYFAETDFQNARTRFGIKESDRLRHMYVIGKKGMGKSTLLEHMALQDMENGNGFVFFDWRGDVAERLLGCVPKDRVKDIVYMSLHDEDHVTPLSIFGQTENAERQAIVPEIMDACERLFAKRWNERVAYILEQIWYALLEYPGATLFDVNRMLTDTAFRAEVAPTITDTQVRLFWTVEFPQHTDAETHEAVVAIEDVMGQFVSDQFVRTIVGVRNSAFHMRRIMDERKIFIVDLSSKRLGEEKRAFLASMLIVGVYAAVISRKDLSSVLLAAVPPFFVYMDDVPSYTGRSFEHMIQDARKAKVGLILAHQYREQMSDEVLRAIFGHIGTMVVFRLGGFDAEIFEKEFAPHCTAEDMGSLGDGEMYVRLMIDGIASPVFWATRLPPVPSPEFLPKKEHAARNEAIAASRASYSVARREAENRTRMLLKKDEEPVAPKDEAARTESERPKVAERQTGAVISEKRAIGEEKEKGQQQRKEPQRFFTPRPPQQRKEERAMVAPPILPDDVAEEKTEEDGSYVSLADLAGVMFQKNDVPSVSAEKETVRDDIPAPENAKQKEEVHAKQSSNDGMKTIPKHGIPGEVPEDVLRKMVE